METNLFDFFLCAEDYAESLILQELAQELRKAGYTTEILCGNGVQPTSISKNEIREKVRNSKSTIVTASNYTVSEIFAAECAREEGKPLALIALGNNGWKNRDFTSLRNSVSLLIVGDEQEKKLAQAFFPSSQIVASGVPQYEEFAFPKNTREEVRQRLNTKDEQLVLVVGDKTPSLNITLATVVTEALRDVATTSSEKYKIIFTLHPGHTPLPSNCGLIGFYEYAFLDLALPIHVSLKGDPFGIGTTDMLPGADVVISVNSMALIQAACLRIPAISILLSGGFPNHSLPKDQFDWWAPIQTGAIAGVYNTDSNYLRRMLEVAFDPDPNIRNMRIKVQERAYPRPNKIGQAYEIMLRSLETCFNLLVK